MRAGVVGIYLVAVALYALGCGDDGMVGNTGGAGAKGMLGERCTTDSCATGLTCGRDFEVANLCTASCTNDQSCSLLAPGSNGRCVVTTSGFCFLPCGAGGACPAGSQCNMVKGQMVCRAP
jgi:hypothetical protein